MANKAVVESHCRFGSGEPGMQGATRGKSVTRLAELEYFTQMLPEMRAMALSLEQNTLAYLLEMASLEAELQLELEIEYIYRSAPHER